MMSYFEEELNPVIDLYRIFNGITSAKSQDDVFSAMEPLIVNSDKANLNPKRDDLVLDLFNYAELKIKQIELVA